MILHPPSMSRPAWLPGRRCAWLLWILIAMIAFHGSQLPAAAREGEVVNRLGMAFVLIPAGTFIMGSPLNETYREVSEIEHQVTISQPFYMQTTEVTIDQWRAVMGRRALVRKKGSGNMPVVKVSWHDCEEFIRKLNHMTGERYLLPTEAQWEYAARGGSRTAYFWGNRIDCSRAMYANNPMKHDGCLAVHRGAGLRSGRPAPVKHYPPNAWGLYDMHGNVWEWCIDLFDHYGTDSQVDPCNTDAGQYRVRRSGSWFGPGYSCRSANRAHAHPMSRLQNTGLRLVMALPDEHNKTAPFE